ncbi:MAG: glycosyltransferase family 4 protein [Deltaproteobacteria bacterium]|nr:glycosyltransferase family 4 protein [Deltaproteobacteria bacterium]
MKTAIVHDWLVTYAGAERVLEQMLVCFPEADLFSLVDFIPPGKRGFIGNQSVTVSALQKFPFARKKYRSYLPVMPLLIEQFDLSGYDLVISSSHAVAKGVLTGPGQLHLCMCYSPIRYAWDLQHQYLREAGLDHGLKGWLARAMLHRVRLWDSRTANGVDGFMAISRFIARRIQKVYGRESRVIYPPVDMNTFTVNPTKEAFYLTASRMVPYKRMDLIVEAFTAMPERKLVVVGDGPDFKKIQKRAGANVQLLGFQETSVLQDLMGRARAFVFAAEEDFGIAPLEAQACGTPVIAFGKGGALETIRGLSDPAPTGVFFQEQTVASLREAVETFERENERITPQSCRANAERFSVERFRGEFQDYVGEQWANFQAGKSRMES